MKGDDLHGGTRGVALVAVLLVLTVLSLVGHATWLVAASELTAAFQERDRLVVRLSTEGLVVRPPTGTFDSLPGQRWTVVRRGGTPEGIRTALSVWPATPELFLLVGEGETRIGRPRWRVGRLFWRLDPSERLSGFSGPFEARLGSMVSPDSDVALAADTVPPGWTTRCAALPEPDSTYRSPSSPDSLLDRLGPTHPLQLGRLDRDELLSRAGSLPAAFGTPEASSPGGLCTAGEWNWGSPDDPAGPCGNRHILRGVEGDLVLDRGVGEGTLVVTGNLTLRGTLFVGVILVGGDLRLEDGATVLGYARSGGSIELVGASRFTRSSCGARVALSHPALRVPLRYPMGSWVRPAPFPDAM